MLLHYYNITLCVIIHNTYYIIRGRPDSTGSYTCPARDTAHVAFFKAVRNSFPPIRTFPVFAKNLLKFGEFYLREDSQTNSGENSVQNSSPCDVNQQEFNFIPPPTDLKFLTQIM